MKIFLSIASYQDPILKYTIESAYENAKYKNNLVLGVFDQALEKLDFSHSYMNIRYKTCKPKDSKGVCWARSKIQTDLFDDEDIFMQIDSHTMFEKNWDEYLLQQYDDANQWLSNPIISAYPRSFEVLVNNDQYLNNSDEYIFKKAHDYKDKGTIIMLAKIPFQLDKFITAEGRIHHPPKQYRGFFMSANFLFTSGQFVHDVPYDPDIYFLGEETTLALRAFTHGYDIVHVPAIPLYHWYNMEQNQLKREIHYDGETTMTKQEKDAGFARAMQVLECQDFSKYGLGKKRTVEEYKEFSGIDYKNKAIEPNKAMTYAEHINNGVTRK